MEKLALTIAEACSVVGIGRTTVYKLISQHELEALTIGRRRLVTTESVRALVASRLAPSAKLESK